MNRRPGRRRVLAAASAAVVLAAAWAASGIPTPGGTPQAPSPQRPAAPPFNNEDIVRLSVHQTPTTTILKEIAARLVDFDLSPGMVEELEHAGVSRTIIEAMRRRQAEMPRIPGPGPDTPVPRSGATSAFEAGHIELMFDESRKEQGKEGDQVFAIQTLSRGLPRPEEAEIGTVSDLALALLCTTTDHVPDHWDTRTPLEGAPRHEVLLFRRGGTTGREKGYEVLSLDRAPTGPIEIASGRHAVLVGWAGRQTGSGSWRLLASAPLRIEVQPGGTTRLILEARTSLSGSRMAGFRMEPVWNVREQPAGEHQSAPPAIPGEAP